MRIQWTFSGHFNQPTNRALFYSALELDGRRRLDDLEQQAIRLLNGIDVPVGRLVYGPEITSDLSSNGQDRDQSIASESRPKRAYSQTPSRYFLRMKPQSMRRTSEGPNVRSLILDSPANVSAMKAGEIVKILQRMANRKGIKVANKTLRYGISRRSVKVATN